MNTIKNGWTKEDLEKRLLKLKEKYKEYFDAEQRMKKIGNQGMARKWQKDQENTQNQINTVLSDLEQLAKATE